MILTLMIFFGWGKKSKEWELSDGTSLLCAWSYFHIFWLPVALRRKWYKVGKLRGDEERLTIEQVKALFGGKLPSIGIWNRFGLLFIVGALALQVLSNG